MKVLSSLRSRIFLASAFLAVLCIIAALYVVNVRVTQEAERTLEREIVATGAQIDQLRAERSQTFTLMARLIADLPKLKAAIDTNDPSTVEDIASGYQAQLHASVLLVTNRQGQMLYSVGDSPKVADIAVDQPAVRDALRGKDTVSLLAQPNGILQIVTVPVLFERPRVDILGTFSAGFLIDDALATQLKKITGSDLAFGMDGRILASTLARDDAAILAHRLRTSGISHVEIGGQEYAVLSRALSAGSNGAAGPVALILRSRTEQLQSLHAIHTAFGVTGVVAIVLAMAFSFTVARTIARPLAAITNVMREVATTGDLTRKITPGHRDRWQDEDARLLATTFNTLTDSIARFQREMSQKERLTSLGRLSTVIAHEVRNPLMIIKASLHALRQPDVTAEAMREAATDIDEEVGRLNRIVNEVLDFARPIRFDLSAVDVNALCRASAAAAQAAGPGAPIVLRLDEELRPITADQERLRMALVNMLVNARHAANGEGEVTLATAANGERVHITIADRGVGISAEDLAHIFDPYFTTKRGGSGLGLPIAKNIIEGLGGTIAVSSARGRGTEIHLELPLR
jgi:signal transduction histidine kinase